MRRRVVVTGIGLLTPLGRAIGDVWRSVLLGVSAIRPVTVQNPATGVLLTLPAAPLSEGDCTKLGKHKASMAGKFAQSALQAAEDAALDSRIDLSVEDPERCGTCFGTHLGGLGEIEEQFDFIYLKKRPRVHPFTVIRAMNNAPNAFLHAAHKISGPALTYSTTCSSSLVAIGEASRQIRHGYADVMLAGGADSPLNHATMNGWSSAQLIAPMHEDPSQSCRPFDATRAGTVLGDGAVFVVLEEKTRALRRGARIYAELAGYAASADFGHISQPSVEGQSRSMRLALQDAAVMPNCIDYINAHGTATRLNDAIETRSIRTVFGEHADQLAVSSAKGHVGHMVGAAGAIGLVFGLLAIATRMVPPTANLRHLDPECDLDYVPLVGRESASLNTVLCNAFGFGGSAASVVLTRDD